MSNPFWGYVIAIALFIGGVVNLVFALGTHQTDADLAAHGTHVMGNVLFAGQRNNSQHLNSSQSDISYYLAVTSLAGGQPKRIDFDVSYLAYLQHAAGSQIEVIYDPQHPAMAQLAGNPNPNSAGYQLLGAILFMLFGGLLAAYLYLQSRPGAQEPWDEPAGP